MNMLNQPTELAGRILLAAIFLLSGLGKISDYAGTQVYMESVGVPGAILPLVIVAEVLGSTAIIIGFLTRVAALGLALFSIASALLFHAIFSDQIQMIMFLKNLAMAGGFLLLVVHGAGPWSMDSKLGRD